MKGFRIKTVARVTGLSPEVLRAWERRYGVVHPSRTPGGYREYSEQDVERLRLLRVLTARGWSIGEIAAHDTAELERMVERLREQSDAVATAAPRGQHAAVVEQLATLASELDVFGFRRALRRALVLLPTAEVAGEVLLPLLARLSARAARQRRRSSGLALALAEVRGFAGPLGVDLPAGAPVALVAPGSGETAAGDPLQVFLRCLEAGWQGILASRDATPEELQEMVRVGGASCVLLTFERAPELGAFLALLDHWLTALPPSCALIVVGRGVEPYARAVTGRGAQFAADAADAGALLRRSGDVG